MAKDDQAYAEIVAYLERIGYSEQEINLILERVRDYEQRVGMDLVMESVADGSFDLSPLIEDALKKTGGRD